MFEELHGSESFFRTLGSGFGTRKTEIWVDGVLLVGGGGDGVEVFRGVFTVKGDDLTVFGLRVRGGGRFVGSAGRVAGSLQGSDAS